MHNVICGCLYDEIKFYILLLLFMQLDFIEFYIFIIVFPNTVAYYIVDKSIDDEESSRGDYLFPSLMIY